jgi:hypothetical protein
MAGPSILPTSKDCSRRPSRSRIVALPVLPVEFVIMGLTDKTYVSSIIETLVAYQSIDEMVLFDKGSVK